MSDYYESDGDAYGYSDEDPHSDGCSDPEEAHGCAGSEDSEEEQYCACSEESEEAQYCAGSEEPEEAQYCGGSEEFDGCEDYESSDIEDINYGGSYKSQSMGNQFGNYEGSSSDYPDRSQVQVTAPMQWRVEYPDRSQVQVTAPRQGRSDYPDRSQVQVTAPRQGRCGYPGKSQVQVTAPRQGRYDYPDRSQVQVTVPRQGRSDYPDKSQGQVTAPRQGLQRGSQEWSFKQSHVERDKQSGGYARLTTKDEISAGKTFKERSTGRDGFKNELKSTTTYRVGDKRGYSEYQIEERHRRVEFGGTPSNKGNRYGPTNRNVGGAPSNKNTRLK